MKHPGVAQDTINDVLHENYFVDCQEKHLVPSLLVSNGCKHINFLSPVAQTSYHGKETIYDSYRKGKNRRRGLRTEKRGCEISYEKKKEFVDD
jgi:hypothetical protein